MEYFFTECETLIPEYVAHELRAKAIEKYPERASLAADFLDQLCTPLLCTEGNGSGRVTIRDSKEQAILDAAFLYDADIIVSGDKDFLALSIDHPRILKPSQFIAEYISK